MEKEVVSNSSFQKTKIIERKQLLTNKVKTYLFALSAVLFWSTSATAFKLSLGGLKITYLLFFASLSSTLVLLLISKNKFLSEILPIIKGKNIKNSIALGFLNPFLYYLVLFKAYSLLPAQEAQPLNYTWPIVISIFSVIFLKQKLALNTIVGLVLAFIGVIVIATRGNILEFHFHDITGVSLAVGSSLAWALFWILNLLDKREESVKLFSSFFFGTVLTGIYILLFDSLEPFDIKYLFGAVYIGLFEMGITFFLWMKALSLSANKAKTATLAYLAPFISLLFISLILGEDLYTSSITGLVLIVGGILYQQTSK